MIRNILESIQNVAVYPVVSLVLFVAVFLGAIVWAITRNRKYVEHMRQLPLTEEKPLAGETRHG